MEKTYFISGQRTAFGAFGGSLKDLSATELSVVAAKAALQKAALRADQIEHVIIGNVVQSGADAAYLARHVGLKSGIPQDVGAFNVNRLCGSGFQGWISAAQMINNDEAHCILTGGVEQMSQIPYVMRNMRFGGIRLGNGELEDFMTSSLTDAHVAMPMAMTAEKLGEKYGITRDQCDEFSFESQARCKRAYEKNLFSDEITPVTIASKKGTVEFNRDEHPKPDVSLEKLKTMKPLFKQNGLVTAATASGIVDGAACSILASESFVKKNNLRPLAQIVSHATVGCDPTIMGIGPAAAVRKALQKANLSLGQMDLIEVNEAFAAQYLSVEKELGLNRSQTNVNGGAIAIGHPLAASGTRIMNHLVFELHRRKAKYAIGSACIGGGQGIAIIVERV